LPLIWCQRFVIFSTARVNALGITEEEAYLAIQRQSRQRRKSKREIAEAILIGEELRRGKVGP